MLEKVKVYYDELNAEHEGDFVRCVNCGALMLMEIGGEFCKDCGSENLMFYDDDKPEWCPYDLDEAGFIIEDDREILNMDYESIIEKLSVIVTELDARESSGNCVTDMSTLDWDELCDLGIDLFKQLKQPIKE